MGKWNITKAFDFCYGHRVWVQKLNPEYLENPQDTCLACRHLHGHQGKVTVELEGTNLNAQSMVTDFKHLGWLKTFIDDYLDHKFIIDKSDPYLKVMLRGIQAGLVRNDLVAKTGELGHAVEPYNVHGQTVWQIEINPAYDFHEREVLEGLVIVDFVPTSEQLANWLFKIVAHKMQPLGVTVSKLVFNETPKTSATYSYVKQPEYVHPDHDIPVFGPGV